MLLCALRQLALGGTEWARAHVSTIRLRLLKIAAEVHLSARRIWIRYPRAYPWKVLFAAACSALRCETQRSAYPILARAPRFLSPSLPKIRRAAAPRALSALSARFHSQSLIAKPENSLLLASQPTHAPICEKSGLVRFGRGV